MPQSELFDLAASIANQFFIVPSVEFRASSLLFGVGLLFGGGYNLYCERLIWGAALMGSGAVIGFWSLIDWSLLR